MRPDRPDADLRTLALYHYKARVYSPTLGRFLQTDPVGYDDNLNIYAYVNNDPLNSTDPTGQCDPKKCGDKRETQEKAERLADKSQDVGDGLAAVQGAAGATGGGAGFSAARAPVGSGAKAVAVGVAAERVAEPAGKLGNLVTGVTAGAQVLLGKPDEAAITVAGAVVDKSIGALVGAGVTFAGGALIAPEAATFAESVSSYFGVGKFVVKTGRDAVDQATGAVVSLMPSVRVGFICTPACL